MSSFVWAGNAGERHGRRRRAPPPWLSAVLRRKLPVNVFSSGPRPVYDPTGVSVIAAGPVTCVGSVAPSNVEKNAWNGGIGAPA